MIFSITAAASLFLILLGLWSKLNENTVEAALRRLSKRKVVKKPFLDILWGLKQSSAVERSDLFNAGVFFSLAAAAISYTTVKNPLLIIFFSLAAFAIVPRLYRGYRSCKVRSDFIKQLGHATEAMVSALLGGLTILEAVKAAAKQSTGEVAVEFERVAVDVESNGSLPKALADMAERVDMEEVYDFAQSLSLLHEAKGNDETVKLLRSASEFIKEKAMLKEKIASYTSSVRFGYAAATLIVAGITAFLYSVMPAYRWVFSRMEGKIIALAAMFMLFLGFMMVRSMIKAAEREI